MTQNKTAQDARNRVVAARVGSLADATDEYVAALLANVHSWLYSIHEEQMRRQAARARAEEAAKA